MANEGEVQMSPQELQTIKEAFSIYDKDGDGTISTKELGDVLRSLGHYPTKSQMQDIINQVDKNNDGVIEFEEFKVLMKQIFGTDKKEGTSLESEIKHTFDLFDGDHNGYLSAAELRRGMIKVIGHKVTELEAEQMLKVADLDGDGFVNYAEFKQAMKFEYPTVFPKLSSFYLRYPLLVLSSPPA